MGQLRRSTDAVVTTAAALVFSACTTWRPVAQDAVQAPPAGLPNALRVTRTDGSRITLLFPFVRQDTLFGRQDRDTLGVALRDVRQLEREHLSAGRSVAFLLALPATLLIVYLVQCQNHRCEPSY